MRNEVHCALPAMVKDLSAFTVYIYRLSVPLDPGLVAQKSATGDERPFIIPEANTLIFSLFFAASQQHEEHRL